MPSYTEWMNTSAVSLPHPLTFRTVRLYVVAAGCILGNIALPIALHSFGDAGKMFLPIYFFTLVSGLVFGWQCGLLTGFLSPVISILLTGMPPVLLLPFIIAKSVLMGSIGGILSRSRVGNRTVLITGITIIVSQLIGSALILGFTHNRILAFSDITVGYPGLLAQIVLIPLISKSKLFR